MLQHLETNLKRRKKIKLEIESHMRSFVESKTSSYWFQMYVDCLLQSILSEIPNLLLDQKAHPSIYFKMSSQTLGWVFQTIGRGYKALSGNQKFSRMFWKLGKCFFSIWVFFHKDLGFIGQKWKWEATSLTFLYHFQPLQRHLDIRRIITANITSGCNRTRNLWCPSSSCQVATKLPILYGLTRSASSLP